MNPQEAAESPEKRAIKPVEYAIFCDHASITTDAKLNLNGIFDGILVKEFPNTHDKLYIVSKFLVPQGEHKITFTLMKDDEVLDKSSIEKKIDKPLAASTHIWMVKNLKLEKAGLLELQMLMDGKQVYIKRMPVVEVPKQDKAAA